MVRAVLLVSCLSFIAIAKVLAGECEHDAQTFRCVRYAKNYDGDTITVDIPNVPPLFGKNISVRIKGVDTAELKTKDKCEKSAARTTQKLVQRLLSNAKRIDLEGLERDKYFRILADVKVDGQSVAEILFKNKLAVPYSGGAKQKINWCAIAERNQTPLN